MNVAKFISFPIKITQYMATKKMKNEENNSNSEASSNEDSRNYENHRALKELMSE